MSPECHLDHFNLVPTGNSILHNAGTCHVTGQNFQLYPATEGNSVFNHWYRDSLLLQHIEPVTCQEEQMLQSRSAPDVSELGIRAATSELYKHGELGVTLVVRDILFLLVFHHYYLSCCPSNYYMQRLSIFVQKPYIQNHFYYTKFIKCHSWKWTPNPPDVPHEESPSTSQVKERKTECFSDHVQRVAWSDNFQQRGQADWKMRVRWSSSFSYPFFHSGKKKYSNAGRKCAALILREMFQRNHATLNLSQK